MAMRESNRRVLAARAPGVVARVVAAPVPAAYEVTETVEGVPVLAIAGHPLQHMREPLQDAARWARATADRLERIGAARAIVIGLALGHHLEALAARFAGAIVVVEPDLAVWRLALEHRDLSELLARVEIAAGDDDSAAPGGRAPLVAERSCVVAYAPALLLPGGAHRRALEQWQASAARTGVRLKILVVSPLYGGSWPIAGYAARALAALGHETTYLDLSSFHDAFRGLERFGARQARRRALESRFCDALADGVVAAVEAHEPDVVLALAQAPLGPAALDAIGAAGAIRVLWFVEDFRVLGYWREVARHYDYVFTIQENECLEAIGAVTDARVGYLPCAFDPGVHRPLHLGPAERAAYGSDVSFVGAGYRNRRLAFRRFLDTDLRIWGSDWDGAADLARVLQRGGARIQTEEAVRIFNASKINLNLHSSTYHEGVDPRGDFVNPRTFELAGCEAFQIVDARSLLPPLFAAGSELAVAASVAEMRALVDHYLERDDERAEIAVCARRHALAAHTYRHRAEAMLTTVLAREQERVLMRSRTATVGDVARGGDGALERFLARLDPTTPFTLERLAASLADREGTLEEPEAILLFLHQFDELYLKEHRA